MIFSDDSGNNDEVRLFDLACSFYSSITLFLQNSRSILLFFITISLDMSYDLCRWMVVQPQI